MSAVEEVDELEKLKEKHDDRLLKGYKLCAEGKVKEISEKEFTVNEYNVIYTEVNRSCSCPDIVYNGIMFCKHICAVFWYLKLRSRASQLQVALE